MRQYHVKLHFHKQKGNYFAYDMWQWQDQVEGKSVSFSKLDYFGVEGNLVYESEGALNRGHVLVKEGDWLTKTRDFEIELLPEGHVREVWILDGDDTVYYSLQAALTSHAYSHRQPHAYDMAMRPREFDAKWAYQGWLGHREEEGEHCFKLWAPTAKKVELLLYQSTELDAPIWKSMPMTRGKQESSYHPANTHGVWILDFLGNLSGMAYQYRVHFEHHTQVTRDPYSIATTADGMRTAILSRADRQFDWGTKKGADATPWRLDNPCQAVIYEMHLRDLTKSLTSGVDESLRGTYLGACQKGTVNSHGDATAFDYIRQLGVNVVQLQPISDRFKQYDEEGQVTYNWGYDVQNYSAPETSFSTDPSNPKQTMKELKTMIRAYHEAGISVVMDVVYNHIYSTEHGPFQNTVPDYYYRMEPDGRFQNGTGVGNETASEHEMYRKYMIDSLTHWVKEYQIDGFRFDLMGIHDVRTMNAIREAMDALDPRILLYGEGWDMGTGLAPEDKAKKDNATQLPRIGFFNDTERDAIKGAEVYGSIKRGFVSRKSTEYIVARAVLGSAELGNYLSPNQVLNYVEAHDNYNLYDLLQTLHPNEEVAGLVKRSELATAMNLLFQGMAFMQLGQEFMRTKLVATGPDGEITPLDRERAMNSYNAPDFVNQVNWDLVSQNKESIAYIRSLIALKTSLPVLGLESYDKIYQQVFIQSATDTSGLVIYELTGDKKYLVIFNASGLPYYLQNSNKLKLMVGNSRHKRPFYVENLTASIFEVLDEGKA
ncbi:type I pullulanase [Streptococcus parasanguinis]|uniref:type I pullulanase n=1 Tax=Streptococcus parasanguinis TaxID=1318 RepID=UPI00066CB87C|nr:type I pullulanase [Streptococcus parasanguinis]